MGFTQKWSRKWWFSLSICGILPFGIRRIRYTWKFLALNWFMGEAPVSCDAYVAYVAPPLWPWNLLSLGLEGFKSDHLRIFGHWPEFTWVSAHLSWHWQPMWHFPHICERKQHHIDGHGSKKIWYPSLSHRNCKYGRIFIPSSLPLKSATVGNPWIF